MILPNRYSAFWQSARIILRYRRQLGIGMIGAVVSAVSFGAGLSMLLPTLRLLLEEGHSLRTVLEEKLAASRLPEQLMPIAEDAVALVPHDRFEAFLAVMAVIVVLSLVGSAGRYFHELMVIEAAQRGSMHWRHRMFARLIQSPMVELLRRGSADEISRVIADTHVMFSGYHAILGKAVIKILHAAAALAVAFWLNWQLTLIGLVGAPIIGVLLRKFGKRVRRASRRAMVHRGEMVGVLKESLGNPRVVKTHNGQGYERRRFNRVSHQMFQEQMSVRKVKALSSPVVEALALIGACLAASVASWYIFQGGVEPEIFMVVLGLLAAAGGSVKPLSGLNNTLQEAESAAERVLQSCQGPAEPSGPEEGDKPKLKRHDTSVRFENVQYTYPGGQEPAVRGVTLDVNIGQTIAVVGGNGSGKTTLLSMLPRLIEPDEGRVLIDGTDIAGVNLRSLRAQMAMVTQNAVLFGGSIADNIAYGLDLPPGREAIEDAAKAAFAHEFIMELPDGYDTELAEGGEGLSGGQRQRLCIARAVLRDPAILILDEATSQVDTESEAKINQALETIRSGRTTFVIAHRLSTVVDADAIAVMERGRLMDVGPHTELLERCEVYRRLAERQLQAADS